MERFGKEEFIHHKHRSARHAIYPREETRTLETFQKAVHWKAVLHTLEYCFPVAFSLKRDKDELDYSAAQ